MKVEEDRPIIETAPTAKLGTTYEPFLMEVNSNDISVISIALGALVLDNTELVSLLSNDDDQCRMMVLDLTRKLREGAELSVPPDVVKEIKAEIAAIPDEEALKLDTRAVLKRAGHKGLNKKEGPLTWL